MDKKYTTKSFKETQKLGEIFAKEILFAQGGPASGGKTATVLCLSGNLGGGKTTFLQGFSKGLGVTDKILSPTFVILKKFRIAEMGCFKYFYHIDAYRLKKAGDVLELNFKEIIKNPENIVAVEWPEKIKKVLPKNKILIDFNFVDENKREIIWKKD